ncbi:MAG: ABC transporter permease [Fimbriimonadia bacterium]|nr:ABC transporter permease [Fimbriimonadia bacterium]
MIDRLLFILNETWANLRRNGLMQFAAISTSTVALILLGSVGMMLYKLDSVAQSLPRKFEIEVFAHEDAKREEVVALQQQLQAMPEVALVQLITKEEAWQQEKDALLDQMDLSDLPNPLPDKLIVSTREPEQIAGVSKRIRQEKVVEDVLNQQETLAQVMSISRFIRWTGFSISGLLMLSALVLIYNAIRLTVLSRQTEVRIMSLVGANHRAIRMPFVLEGAVQGGLGGMLASGMVLLGARMISDYTSSAWPFLDQLPGGAPVWSVLASLVALGVLLGGLSASWAAQRFVKI